MREGDSSHTQTTQGNNNYNHWMDSFDQDMALQTLFSQDMTEGNMDQVNPEEWEQDLELDEYIDLARTEDWYFPEEGDLSILEQGICHTEEAYRNPMAMDVVPSRHGFMEHLAFNADHNTSGIHLAELVRQSSYPNRWGSRLQVPSP